MIDLKSCFGEQYDACISVDYLISIRVDPVNAQLTVSTAAQQIFICTTGWSGKSPSNEQ